MSIPLPITSRDIYKSAEEFLSTHFFQTFIEDFNKELEQEKATEHLIKKKDITALGDFLRGKEPLSMDHPLLLHWEHVERFWNTYVIHTALTLQEQETILIHFALLKETLLHLKNHDDPLTVYRRFLDIQRNASLPSAHPAHILYNKIEYIHSALVFGTLEEIGASTPIQNLLFTVPGASKTVKNARSTYSKEEQEQLYGTLERSVSEEAVLTYCYEYLEDLQNKENPQTFSLAFSGVTISSEEGKQKGDHHGWFAICLEDGSAYSIHVRLLAKDRPTQQFIVGLFGINLLYHIATEGTINDPTMLVEFIAPYIEVDSLSFFPTPKKREEVFPNILRHLELLEKGVTPLVLFLSDNEEHIAGTRYLEVLRSHSLLVNKGSFNPPTIAHEEMFEKCRTLVSEDYLPVFELSLSNVDKTVESLTDLAHRIVMLRAIGFPIIVTKTGTLYSTKELLEERTGSPVSFLCGSDLYLRIFMDKYYTDLSGGLEEGIARLFAGNTHLYVCERKSMIPLPEPPLDFLERYKKTLHFLPLALPISATQVRRGISEDTKEWKTLVRESVAQYIDAQKLYRQ